MLRKLLPLQSKSSPSTQWFSRAPQRATGAGRTRQTNTLSIIARHPHSFRSDFLCNSCWALRGIGWVGAHLGQRGVNEITLRHLSYAPLTPTDSPAPLPLDSTTNQKKTPSPHMELRVQHIARVPHGGRTIYTYERRRRSTFAAVSFFPACASVAD